MLRNLEKRLANVINTAIWEHLINESEMLIVISDFVELDELRKWYTWYHFLSFTTNFPLNESTGVTILIHKPTSLLCLDRIIIAHCPVVISRLFIRESH